VLVASAAFHTVPLVLAMSAVDSTVIFQDDFETYNVGTFPSKGAWILKHDGAGVQYQIATDKTSRSPSKSLQLVGTSMWTAAADRSIATEAKVIGFDAYVRVDSYGSTPDCGSTSGDLYTLPSCPITAEPMFPFLSLALLTTVVGSQDGVLTAEPGQTISVTVNYQVWLERLSDMNLQLMFIACWTPSWPPPPGYYWGIYSSIPPLRPGISGSATFQVKVPSVERSYYLWFVASRFKTSYEEAIADFRNPLTAPPAHIKLIVARKAMLIDPFIVAVVVIAVSAASSAFVLYRFKSRKLKKEVKEVCRPIPPVAETKFCITCRAELPIDAKFCDNCGASQQ